MFCLFIIDIYLILTVLGFCCCVWLFLVGASWVRGLLIVVASCGRAWALGTWTW